VLRDVEAAVPPMEKDERSVETLAMRSVGIGLSRRCPKMRESVAAALKECGPGVPTIR